MTKNGLESLGVDVKKITVMSGGVDIKEVKEYCAVR